MNEVRPNALSAARTAIAGAWFATVMGIALVTEHPLVLGALLALLVLVAIVAGASRVLLITAAWTVPMALMVGVVNALLSRDGLTVVARFGEIPVLGRVDVTLEAIAHGGVLALRVVVVASAVALFAACVDQDDLVGLVRRRSGRFGVAMALAARMVPLLGGDAKRMSQARRVLDQSVAPPRSALLTALVGGALDRSVDAAATLELRGLGDGPCLAPPDRRPWSRHDLAVFASALALLAVAVCGMAFGWSAASWKPRIEIASGVGSALLATVLFAVAGLPLIERRGIGR